jgi:hypothetical protein
MKHIPMLRPRTTRIVEIATIDVCAPMNVSGIVLRHSSETPVSATRPPPKRSVRRLASGIATSAPIPCGPVSNPVLITSCPRTDW